MLTQANQALPEGTRLQNYRVERLLASGGFSYVYLAQDEARGERLAIKESRATFHLGVTVFFDDAALLARLDHPNVVRVLDCYRANDTVYLVMRYEQGRSLQEQIKAREAPAEEIWLRNTFAQLLDGLRKVHARKLLPLDIKPANIYL